MLKNIGTQIMVVSEAARVIKEGSPLIEVPMIVVALRRILLRCRQMPLLFTLARFKVGHHQLIFRFLPELEFLVKLKHSTSL
jgi:hypothetical protein